MKLDDLIAQDSKDNDLDDYLVSAMGAFGFVSVDGTDFWHPTRGWIYTITAKRADGSSLTWIGVGNTSEEARLDAIDAISKWILNQPIPQIP